MGKLRKMLGDIHSEECTELMALIGSQSKQRLGFWAISYAKSAYLPILQIRNSELSQFENAVALCEEYLEGKYSPAQIKSVLRELRQLAAGIQDPISQAAARAVSTACAAIQTPSNAFGFLLYGAAATAYQRAGLEQSQNIYDRLAAEELSHALESLRHAAVPDEPNPVQINWNC